MQHLKNYSILSLTIAILVLHQPGQVKCKNHRQQGSSKPASKFVKAKNPVANRYIVVLNDDVVSEKLK